MSRDRSSSKRDARGRPTRGGRARQCHLNLGSAQSSHGQEGSPADRTVPGTIEAARHVAYPYDRPRALHRVPTFGLILVWTDLGTTGTGRKSSPPGRQPIVLHSLLAYPRTCRTVFLPTVTASNVPGAKSLAVVLSRWSLNRCSQPSISMCCGRRFTRRRWAPGSRRRSLIR